VDFSTPKYYLHDGISSDRDNPRLNANGPIYGAPEESTDLIPVLDPVTHTASQIKHPVPNPNAILHGLADAAFGLLGQGTDLGRPSSIHNAMMDSEGRVWFKRQDPAGAQPGFLQERLGSIRLPRSRRSMPPAPSFGVRPKTGKWMFIDTCFPTHHLYFAKDANRTLWFSQGGPASGVIGWVNTKLFLETGDSARSQGWTQIIVDTNGNGGAMRATPGCRPRPTASCRARSTTRSGRSRWASASGA